jgi:FtsP/CotA-like multicopper oxidase with cupredoxin domain
VYGRLINTNTAKTHSGRMHLILATSLISALLIAGCSGGSSEPADDGPTGTIPSPPVGSQLITGQALKGPMIDATVEVLGPDGNVLATGLARNGYFELTADISAQAYVEIRTRGGYFVDEATGSRVNVSSDTGLHAFVAASEFATGTGQIVLTPETTIVAGMTRRLMQAGNSLQSSMEQARATLEQQFIGDSRPAGTTADTDIMMRFGTPLSPENMQDSLAWQRARAFSFYAQELNLAGDSVFRLMDALALDMHDSMLDGRDAGDPISFPLGTGDLFDMTAYDHMLRFSQARTGAMQHDLWTVINGDASTEFRHYLELMSVDLAPFDMLHQQHRDGISTTAENLAADNLPAFQHLPVMVDEDGDPQNQQGHYTLRAVPDVDVTIKAPGTSWTTPMYRYNGMQLPPVIRAKRGDEMFLTLVNELADTTTIHWHGFKVPALEDGGPTEPVKPNAMRAYHFTLDQPAASLWFHPDPQRQTAEQVYRGLTGVFLLSDDIDEQLRRNNLVPAIAHDIPILVQDRLFEIDVSGERQLTYSDDHNSGFGFMGGTTLVNGVELPRLDVETRQYTLRLYNGSNSRTYDFALSDGRAFYIVGSDGGWLPQPVQADHVLLSAGERAAIVVDFAANQVGDRVMLVSRPFMSGPAMGVNQFDASPQHGDMGGMGMGGEHHSGTSNSGEPGLPGEGTDVMRFDIDATASDVVHLYDRLPDEAQIRTRLSAQDATVERSFVMSWSDTPEGFLINGKQYAEDRVDEFVTAGATEIWEITNISPVPHSFHAPAIQWQVLSRNNYPPAGAEIGWKDTVLVNPGDNVRIIGRFEAVNVGKYVYHCHILEHADDGMMGLIEVLR